MKASYVTKIFSYLSMLTLRLGEPARLRGMEPVERELWKDGRHGQWRVSHYVMRGSSSSFGEVSGQSGLNLDSFSSPHCSLIKSCYYFVCLVTCFPFNVFFVSIPWDGFAIEIKILHKLAVNVYLSFFVCSPFKSFSCHNWPGDFCQNFRTTLQRKSSHNFLLNFGSIDILKFEFIPYYSFC